MGVTPQVTSFESLSALNQMIVPDLWQQEAVAQLRAGLDVVVQAPTGSGKTLIFELWSNQGKNRDQAIYTVPTRALANDKLAEWRARGWDVGIATGDLAENLSAPILVATLETQKNRLIQGRGPALLIVDEYQMLGDPDRGLNYELALALAPPATQLLLLSGSVANPQEIVRWLGRLGRQAVLIRHDQRPVPLEEVNANQLNYHVPSELRGYWPRLVAKALAEGLGPILLFAPRRQAAEALANELSRQLPTPNPLALNAAQKQLVGEALARMLKNRVAYHHSGLSYGTRAGVIEPLAKAGQLRVVVATMGLAAGINFSLRSVALAGDSYRRDFIEQPLKADEILQMCGRAGRRGIDETGYVLVTATEIRMRDGYPCHLSRSGLVDWSALLGVMSAAAERGEDPFAAAVRVQERLFTTRPIFLGVEQSMKNPVVPCGLHTDPERARHVRKRLREMWNSQGQWERYPELQERPWGQIRALAAAATEAAPGTGLDPAGDWRLALSHQPALERVGHGYLVRLSGEDPEPVYGRAFTVAERISGDRISLVKWVRRLLSWHGRQAPLALWEARIAPLLEQKLAQRKTPLARFIRHEQKIVAYVRLDEQIVRVPVDSHGVPLWNPPVREVMPEDCRRCPLVPVCRKLSTASGVAMLWRRLGLIQVDGRPSRRGRLVSFFSPGDGLAIAAALEDESYPFEELIYDVANLDAGFRFCGEEHRWDGRLALVCRQTFGPQNIPGYLEQGVPPKYGAGAEQVVASVHKNPLSKHGWITDWLGAGDIDRAIIEWRSLLRQAAHAPALEWPRWTAFQEMARTILHETESPTLTDLPALEYHQTKRIEHQLLLRRH